MASILQAAFEQYRILFYEKTDPRLRNWPLMPSPLSTIIIVAFYVHFVKISGPKFMEHRNPFNVRKLMIVYNLFQILMNGYLFLNAFIFANKDLENVFCSITDNSNETEMYHTVFVNYLYFISKMIDLLDTVFMVLRKKFNQITFLHVYHHTIMALVSWVFTAYYPGGYAVYFGIINTFVHIVMYSYYFSTLLYPELSKSLWWKKHLTQLQLGQFVIVAIHSSIVALNPYCEFPNVVLTILIPQPLFFFILFWDFYKNTYLKKKN